MIQFDHPCVCVYDSGVESTFIRMDQSVHLLYNPEFQWNNAGQD